MPTEDLTEAGETLRRNGGEFGATTGRPRRCGWLDLVGLKYSMALNGADTIALTKLDVLTGIGPIKVCVAYEYEGERLDRFPVSTRVLEAVKPIYETLPGWSDDIAGCRTIDSLPQAAQDYVRYIEKELNVPVGLIAVGADRDQAINCGLLRS